MTEVNWPTPFGYTIFCDDIRHELDGKTTLVGIYATDMIFRIPLPAILPKLGFVIKYFERPGESSDPVKIQIFLPGDEQDKPTIEAELPYEEMRARPPPSDPEAKDPRIGVSLNLGMAPFKVAKEGRIKVQAIRGSEVIRLGSLRVKVAPKDQSEPAPSAA